MDLIHFDTRCRNGLEYTDKQCKPPQKWYIFIILAGLWLICLRWFRACVGDVVWGDNLLRFLQVLRLCHGSTGGEKKFQTNVFRFLLGVSTAKPMPLLHSLSNIDCQLCEGHWTGHCGYKVSVLVLTVPRVAKKWPIQSNCYNQGKNKGPWS